MIEFYSYIIRNKCNFILNRIHYLLDKVIANFEFKLESGSNLFTEEDCESPPALTGLTLTGRMTLMKFAVYFLINCTACLIYVFPSSIVLHKKK